MPFPTSSPGRFSLALGAKAREKRPGDEVVPFQPSGVRKGREIPKGEGYPSFRSVKGLKRRLTDAL